MSSIRMPNQSKRRVSERKESFPNANNFSAKRELAMTLLHNICTRHTVETFNFNRKVVCQDHVTIDLKHRLLGLGERRLLNECVHRTKSPGPKVRCCHGTRRAVSQKG